MKIIKIGCNRPINRSLHYKILKVWLKRTKKTRWMYRKIYIIPLKVNAAQWVSCLGGHLFCQTACCVVFTFYNVYYVLLNMCFTLLSVYAQNSFRNQQHNVALTINNLVAFIYLQMTRSPKISVHSWLDTNVPVGLAARKNKWWTVC